MKLLLQSAMIFFGTLLTAAVVALGEPAQAGAAWTADVAWQSRAYGVRHEATSNHLWTEMMSARPGFELR